MGTVEQLPVKLVPLTAEHWPWVTQRAKPVLCEDTKGIVATRGPKIAGAAIFDNWTQTSCQGHIIIEDPRITRKLYRASFDYVFNQAGRRIFLGLTPGDNTRALRLAKGMGFSAVHRIKDGYRLGVDYVLFELRKEDCRMLNLFLGKAA